MTINVSNSKTKTMSIQSIDISGGTMTLQGTNLDDVTSITPVSSNATGYSAIIEAKTPVSLRFRLENSVPSTLNFVVGTLLSFMVSTASAQSTVNVIVSSMPSGTVIAYDGTTCPSGWSAFALAEGRVIVGINGAANMDKDGRALTSRTLRSTGGRELDKVTVTAAKSTPTRNDPDDGDIFAIGMAGIAFSRLYKAPDVSDTLVQIGDGDNDNMSPYVALKYCRKD
jgi:hypothetical protein